MYGNEYINACCVVSLQDDVFSTDTLSSDSLLFVFL